MILSVKAEIHVSYQGVFWVKAAHSSIVVCDIPLAVLKCLKQKKSSNSGLSIYPSLSVFEGQRNLALSPFLYFFSNETFHRDQSDN